MEKTVLFMSNSDEWATPKEVYEMLDKEFNFTLDPCATVQNHKCKKFYVKSDNGLTKDWGGGGNVGYAILHTAI